MPRQEQEQQERPLPTIWRVPDELWAKIDPILAEYDRPKQLGRKRIDQRRALDGIIYRLRSGVQGNEWPKEFGDDSSLHRTFQRLVELRVFDHLWAALIADCAELGGVDWEWQVADAAMGNARLGGDQIGPNPTDRGKNRMKRSLLTEADGGAAGGSDKWCGSPRHHAVE
jgi:putative transposase